MSSILYSKTTSNIPYRGLLYFGTSMDGMPDIDKSKYGYPLFNLWITRGPRGPESLS